MGGRPAGTGHLKDEVEMSEAIFGRSVEEAGLQTVMYKQGCAHYRTYWAESGRALAQSKVFQFPVAAAAKEEQGGGKLRNRWFSRKPHVILNPQRTWLTS